ncbi:helix-turn-helix domain-containing protein [Rhodococcus sp. (in: high G+C Gram-positive bacteria)]|uniref:helix-turn-helix domain-containing protein n=1 Tax=Rhodococcus sp. TaxID=1831 RepID=UPI00257C7FD9|nr:helix-turn-helix domain-containing protein [Rhodococcus sp. (in: high G+C Gram-positive bacteria)]
MFADPWNRVRYVFFLAAARARGRKGGRPPKLSDDQIALAQRLYDEGENTVAQIVAMLNVPHTTVYGHLDKKNASAPPRQLVPPPKHP